VMMEKIKVIYNTCYADPWFQVAQKQHKEKGLALFY